MQEDSQVIEEDCAAPEAMAQAVGAPRYNRRLGDKLLAAFNHAYAIGAFEVAGQLREILARIESGSVDAGGDARRRSPTTLGSADLWMAFVEARNDYQAACGSGLTPSPTADSALAAMKRAYEAWMTN